MKKNSNIKKWLTLIILSLAGSVIYRLPYLRETYYIPLQQATGSTNAQLGMLMSAYGLANFILYFPGGWAADRFSTRKLISFSLVATGLVGFYYATFPPFAMLVVIHGIFAITTVFTFWAAAIRVIRLLGDSKEQGRLFGFWTFGKGLTSTILGFISVPVFVKFGEGILGLRGTIIFYSVICIVVGILAYLALDDRVASEESNKISFKEMAKVLKYPSIWLAGILVFASWSIYIGFGMVTPYLTDVFKMTASLAAVVSVVRANVLFSAGGLLGGFLADKIGSRIKFMLYCCIGMIIFTGVYYFMPGDPSLINLVVINLIALGLFVYSNNAIFFSVIDEIKIPENMTGTAAGLMSLIGYFPEIFLYTTVGKMVDNNPGITGYRHIFLFMIVCGILGVIASSILIKLNKKNASN